MPPPPPAETVASRLFLGPTLRTQPDRRLVKLVRDGYEAAFEEIVRRYGKPLGRYATAIVGGRAEDVTQDAFSKALLAMRRDGTEIELRPWLYRIVRNTALNDLRDRPPTVEELEETIEGGRSASEEVESREEVAELMSRLRALPEPQRAAIVMRELEGLSHEEIAATLGITGGAARQIIYRARVALRDGLGLLVPLPLLRALADHGAEATIAGAGGIAAGGAGGGALKLGVATVLVAGSVTGLAIHVHDHRQAEPATAVEVTSPTGSSSGLTGSTQSTLVDASGSPSDQRRSESGRGEDHGGDSSGRGDQHGRGEEPEPSDDSGGADRSGQSPQLSAPQHGAFSPQHGSDPSGSGPGPGGSNGGSDPGDSSSGPGGGFDGAGSGDDRSDPSPQPPPPDDSSLLRDGDGSSPNSGPGSSTSGSSVPDGYDHSGPS